MASTKWSKLVEVHWKQQKPKNDGLVRLNCLSSENFDLQATT